MKVAPPLENNIYKRSKPWHTVWTVVVPYSCSPRQRTNCCHSYLRRITTRCLTQSLENIFNIEINMVTTWETTTDSKWGVTNSWRLERFLLAVHARCKHSYKPLNFGNKKYYDPLPIHMRIFFTFDLEFWPNPSMTIYLLRLSEASYVKGSWVPVAQGMWDRHSDPCDHDMPLFLRSSTNRLSSLKRSPAEVYLIDERSHFI